MTETPVQIAAGSRRAAVNPQGAGSSTPDHGVARLRRFAVVAHAGDVSMPVDEEVQS